MTEDAERNPKWLSLLWKTEIIRSVRDKKLEWLNSETIDRWQFMKVRQVRIPHKKVMDRRSFVGHDTFLFDGLESL